MTNAVNEALNYCYDHYSDPDLVRLCTEARHVSEMEQNEAYLAAVLEITVRANGCAMVGCNCTTFGAALQPIVDFFNQTNLELQTGITWEQLMDQTLEDYKKQYTCEEHKNAFDILS